MSVVADI